MDTTILESNVNRQLDIDRIAAKCGLSTFEVSQRICSFTKANNLSNEIRKWSFGQLAGLVKALGLESNSRNINLIVKL